MVRRALTRQTQWYQIRCSIFKTKDFIVEKPFWKILEFWPLETPILTWAKKWPKWFRNDFSRAFERCLSFFSTATRSRDHGGGRSNAPPPAGGGKSRGPAGRGLTIVLITSMLRLQDYMNDQMAPCMLPNKGRMKYRRQTRRHAQLKFQTVPKSYSFAFEYNITWSRQPSMTTDFYSNSSPLICHLYSYTIV